MSLRLTALALIPSVAYSETALEGEVRKSCLSLLHNDTQEAPLQEYPSIKVLLVGSANVGKSTFLGRYTDPRFEKTHTSNTVGVDIRTKLETIGGRVLRVMLWDTAGRERYRALTPSVYHKTHSLLLMYDMNQASSIEELIEVWLPECLKHFKGPQRMVVSIVGTKKDLVEIPVPFEGVQRLVEVLAAFPNHFRLDGVYQISAYDEAEVLSVMRRVVEGVEEAGDVWNPRPPSTQQSVFAGYKEGPLIETCLC